MPGRGDTIGGRYRLVEKIGEGGMGTVWLASTEPGGPPRGDDAGGPSGVPGFPAAGDEVALKVLHGCLVDDVRSVERFRMEARAASRVDHPNVCGVLDVGEVDGVPFMVMPRLKGESVADHLLLHGAMPEREAMGVIADVLDALVAAHAGGILHRDLKPENVFLACEGGRVVVKVLDFGVAKFIGDDAERVKLTRTGALVGTPAYMSPEQAMGREDVDARADVWAAGVLLYEMLAARLPYEGSNYNALLVNIATRPPRPLRAVRSAVDAGVLAVVERALQRDRDTRFRSARAMLAAARAWLAGEPHPDLVGVDAAAADLAGDAAVDTAPPKAHELVTLGTGRSSRWRAWGVPMVTAGALSVAVVVLWNGRGRKVAGDAVTAVDAPRHAGMPESFDAGVVGVTARGWGDTPAGDIAVVADAGVAVAMASDAAAGGGSPGGEADAGQSAFVAGVGGESSDAAALDGGAGTHAQHAPRAGVVHPGAGVHRHDSGVPSLEQDPGM